MYGKTPLLLEMSIVDCRLSIHDVLPWKKFFLVESE